MNVKKFSVAEFRNDMIIEDDVWINGSSTAYGQFRAFSLILDDNFQVQNELRTSKGKIEAKGDLIVGMDLISADDIIVQKNCRVGGNINGGKIRLFGLNNSAVSIGASTLHLEGNINVQSGITASESIFLFLNPRRWSVNIGGIIKAPFITIKFVGFFTKWTLLSDKIFRRVGRNDIRVKRQFDLGNLKISTKKLIIKTRFPPERVEILSNQAEIIADEIEIIQVDDTQIMMGD